MDEIVKRKPFDLQEAVVLLDVYLNFRKKGLTVTKSAEIASQRLRTLAANRGMKIDDSYRSPMGLQNRLRTIGNIFEGTESASTISTKVFREAVNLYSTNNDMYQRLLKNADINDENLPKTVKKKRLLKKTKFVKNSKDKALKEQFGTTFSKVYYALKQTTKKSFSVTATDLFLFLGREIKRKDIISILNGASWAKEISNNHYLFYDKESEKKGQKRMEDFIKNTEKDFFEWLPCTYAPTVAEEIAVSYKSINMMLIQKKVLSQPLAAIQQIGQIEEALQQIKKTFSGKKNRRSAERLLKAYLAYLREKKNRQNSEEELKIEVKEDWIRFDLSNMRDFERTMPAYCAVDKEEITGRNWARILVGIVEHELKKDNPALEVLYKQSLMNGSSKNPFFMESKIEGLNCSRLTNGYWINVNYSIPRLMEQIRAFCLHCGYDKSKIIIYGVPKKGTQINDSDSKSNNGISIKEAESYLKSIGLKGATTAELISQIQPNAAFTPTKSALNESLNFIAMPGNRYIHVDAFVDLDEAEKKLGQILQMNFVQFSGYSNNKLLFGAAEHDLSMFLNDNDCADEDSVYALAQYFFDKKRDTDKYIFSYPHIFKEKPDYPLSVKGLMINLARMNGGILDASEAKDYLQKTMLSSGSLNQTLQISSSDTFLLYDEERYMLSEEMDINEDKKQILRTMFEEIFKDENVIYVIPRDITKSWLGKLPSLPNNLNWTLLLLQEVLKKFPEIGFIPIKSGLAQSLYTVAAAIVPADSGIQSFSDVVVLLMKEQHGLPIRMTYEELHNELRNAGMIEGRELIYALPDVLNDYRFTWADENKTVLIREW